jgi:hypothetical protein
MKVKCINNKYYDDRLALDKIYEVIAETTYYYQIIDNTFQKTWWNKKWFKTMLEIRNEKINKLLEDDN